MSNCSRSQPTLCSGVSRTPDWDFSRKRRLMAEAEAFLKAHNIPLNPRATVGSLPFAYRQMTEISKALMGRVRVLVLDEPTSALTSDEEQILFDAVGAVIAQGVGVVYVTHRLNEVFRISNRVTVLRDGANVGTFNTAETDMKTLVAAIVGPKLATAEARAAAEPRPPAQPGADRVVEAASFSRRTLATTACVASTSR